MKNEQNLRNLQNHLVTVSQKTGLKIESKQLRVKVTDSFKNVLLPFHTRV